MFGVILSATMGSMKHSKSRPVDFARRAALDALVMTRRDNIRLDTALDESFAGGRLDGRDKAFARAIAYGTVRWRRSLDCIITRFSSRPVERIDPYVLILLRLGLFQVFGMSRTPVFAAVNGTVTMAKELKQARASAGFVNAVLRRALREITPGGNRDQPVADIVADFTTQDTDVVSTLGEINSFPDWIVKRWIDNHGVTGARAILRASNEPAPVFFRLNRLKVNLSDRESLFDTAGIGAEKVVWSDDLYMLTEGRLAPDCSLFTDGYIQPQDGASYMAASILDPKPGELIADACCGKGIKTGLFAQEGGMVVSFDVDRGKLVALKANMQRLGCERYSPVCADMTIPWPVSRRLPASGRFDKIFLDAPCSGTGLFRRHPEGKWTKTEELVRKMAAIQAIMLPHAIDRLNPGGALVYAVCSIEPEEGTGMIEKTLSANGKLRRVDLGLERPELNKYCNDRGELSILPGDDGMDGFFAAKLELS